MYEICTNYIEILAGTSNRTSRAYTEASDNVEKDSPSSMRYLTNFLVSIEKVAGKVEDKRISDSKGNVKNFSGYENIKTVTNFLRKNLSGISTVGDCVDVFNALENFQSLYTEGYEKNCKFIILEYENALYMLVTALSTIMATKMEVVTSGTEIKIQQKSSSTFGVIEKTIKELATQMKDRNHRSYLEEMLKATDNPKDIEEAASENSVLKTTKDLMDIIGALFSNVKKLGFAGIKLFKMIKNSFFGIIPLIRSIIYLRYKKKADTIAALEEQAAFIMENIEQLKNIKTMDPDKKYHIIMKQKAIAKAYMKKAEKLRAELCETEKEASVEIQNQNADITKAEDDFVLEHFSHMDDADPIAE